MAVPHPAGEFRITTLYSVPDDAWYLELDHLPSGGTTLMLAIVPDEDPAREPSVCVCTPTGSGAEHIDIPVPVLRWYLEQVEREVENCRAWMRLRPEVVSLIKELRDEYGGGIGDEHYPPVLARLRAELAQDDLADVLPHAFGRTPEAF
ncbi:hypothetical protein GCM10009759_36120 [Kitasatospora saccharophila]|uniref:Immunity protein 8 of polymorphic toxin system n=1 Tax=Kitasatospora saccharophila TaxID=407973 RepID=A0ABN2WZY0_9ACTN